MSSFRVRLIRCDSTVLTLRRRSIGKSNGLFHRRRAPTLSPTPRHRKPSLATPARQRPASPAGSRPALQGTDRRGAGFQVAGASGAAGGLLKLVLLDFCEPRHE